MRNDGGLQEIAVGAGLVPAHIVRSTMIKSGNAREQSGQGQALPLHPVLSTPIIVPLLLTIGDSSPRISAMRPKTAAIVVIGNEILTGKSEDKNASFLITEDRKS